MKIKVLESVSSSFFGPKKNHENESQKNVKSAEPEFSTSATIQEDVPRLTGRELSSENLQSGSQNSK